MTLSDELKELQDVAKRERLDKEAAQRIGLLRSRFLMDGDPSTAFFADVVMRLKPVIRWDMDTMATDGRHLFYNPEFTMSLSIEEGKAVLSHEVLHVVLDHPARLLGRDMTGWNIACDFAINSILRKAGIKLPDGVLYPEQMQFPDGQTADWYYQQLPKGAKGGKGQGGGPGSGKGNDPGKCGGVVLPGDGSPEACQASSVDAKVIAASAAQAAQRKVSQARGTVPAWITETTGFVLAPPKIPWQTVLAAYLTRRSDKDRSIARPNRRFIDQNIYVPGRFSRDLEPIAVAIDTSGSVSNELLSEFLSETMAILEQNPAKLSVIWCDCAVQRIDTWEPGDDPLQLVPAGRGGTSHRPVFEAIAKMEEPPAVVVCLTDLYTDFPPEPPEADVLWIVPESSMDVHAPWGQKVSL